MDFRAAAVTAPVWERRLHALAFSSDAGARADAIAWYEELARLEGSPLAELYRIILLAEDGQTEAAESVAAAWAPADDTGRQLAEWARTAYEAEPPPPEELRATIDAVRRELTPGWFADRLLIRLASRLGDRWHGTSNELEAVGDRIYANVWHTDDIVIFDRDGTVTGVIDASSVVPPGLDDPESVLNGIAHRPGDPEDRLLVTGKRWPFLYEVTVVPA